MRQIVAILGGSSAFTPAFAAVLARRAPELPALEIRLHGRDPARVAAVARFCQRYAGSRGIDHDYRSTTSIREAAAGARVVINQMRIGGWAGRVRDEVFPLAYDMPGDESIGPGGLASAVRSLPVVLHAAKEVLAVAPGAWFLNMTNPMNILLAGLGSVRGLRCFGLCELPRVTLARALSRIHRRPEEVDADYLGLNHQGWFVRITAGETDLLPGIFSALEEGHPDLFFGVDTRRMRELCALPLPYLRLYYHTDRVVKMLRARPEPRGRELAAWSEKLHRHYAVTNDPRFPPELTHRVTPWYEDWVDALRALMGGPPARLYVSSVNHGDVPGLSPGAVVERLATVTAEGWRTALFHGSPPVANGAWEPFLVFLRRLVDYEEAAAAAALEPGMETVLAALGRMPFQVREDRMHDLALDVLKPLESGPPVAGMGGLHGPGV